jgi:cold shock CspA family protein
MQPIRLLGTLARWNTERGFGFITPDSGGADIFVHATDMSRIGGAPQIGWRLDFRIRDGKDGRPRAYDVQREGMPLVRPSRAEPNAPPMRPRREPLHRPSRRRSPVLAIVVVAALGAGAFLFQRDDGASTPSGATPMPLAAPIPASDAPSPFKCDGRTHCSQMTSCEEATFFLEHCPGTKMDGNGDGVPCEQQWCD